MGTDTAPLDEPIGGTRSPKQVEDDLNTVDNSNKLPHNNDNEIVHPANTDNKEDDHDVEGRNQNNGQGSDIENQDDDVENQDDDGKLEDDDRDQREFRTENEVGGADVEKREKVKEVQTFK